METIVSRTLSVHKEHEVLLKLEAAGLDDELAQRVINSKGNDLATKVVKLIQNGGFDGGAKPSTSQGLARAIMGQNFYGPWEAFDHFGIKPLDCDLDYLNMVPFDSDVLRASRNTHVLVAVFPMSILDIRDKEVRKLFYSRHGDAWYNKQAFAKDKGKLGWQLVRKVPIADSTNLTWSQQQLLLGKDEETPTARVMVYMIIGHFLKTRERLFENIHVRCSDLDSGGVRVVVGCFDAGGLSVADWDDDRHDGNIGLSAARKQ